MKAKQKYFYKMVRLPFDFSGTYGFDPTLKGYFANVQNDCGKIIRSAKGFKTENEAKEWTKK